MTKPVIVTQAGKAGPLTYTELDTNFTNLRDATFGVTDGTNSHDFDLNSRITFTAGSNITLAVNPSTGAITISSSGAGTINSGADGMLPYYSGAGTTLDDSYVKNSYDSVGKVTTLKCDSHDVDGALKLEASVITLKTGSSSVNTVVTYGLAVGEYINAKGFISGASATYPSLETRGNVASYANNATVDFSNFSGMILVNRQDTSGNVALWLCGSGAALKLGDSTGTAVSGTITHNSGINGYRWTNNTGGTITVAFASIKTRDGA